MNQVRVLSLISAFLLGSGLASGQTTTTHTIFVTAPTDGKVLKVVVTVNEGMPPTANTPSVTLIKKASNFTPKEIALGPDGKLYVVSVNKIFRMNQNGTGFTTFYTHATNLGGIRFLANALYFTATTGVWRIPNLAVASSEQVVNQSLAQPGGIFFSFSGQLLFIDSAGTLFRASPPFTACSLMCTSAGPIQTGLASPISIGINAIGSTALLNLNTKYISTNGQVSVFTCNSGGCVDKSMDIFFTPDSPRDFEFDLSARGFVATQGSVPKLWRVEPPDDPDDPTPSPVLLVPDFSALSGQRKANSIWGVALPPTSTSETLTFSTVDPQTFNCGNSLVQLSLPPGPMGDVTIDCQMDLPGNVNPAFSGPAAGALCVQYDWAPFCTKYDIQLPTGVIGDNVNSKVFYLRAIESSLPISPQWVRNFNELHLQNYWSIGPLGPEDWGRGDSASVGVLADLTVNNPATFVDFFPHIELCSEGTSTVTGNQLPVRPLFDPDCTTPEGTFTLQLSVACEDGTFVEPVTSVGGANEGNFFRCDPASGKYLYNLSLDNVPIGPRCHLAVWGGSGAFVDGCIIRQ